METTAEEKDELGTKVSRAPGQAPEARAVHTGR